MKNEKSVAILKKEKVIWVYDQNSTYRCGSVSSAGSAACIIPFHYVESRRIFFLGSHMNHDAQYSISTVSITVVDAENARNKENYEDCIPHDSKENDFVLSPIQSSDTSNTSLEAGRNVP